MHGRFNSFLITFRLLILNSTIGLSRFTIIQEFCSSYPGLPVITRSSHELKDTVKKLTFFYGRDTNLKQKVSVRLIFFIFSWTLSYINKSIEFTYHWPKRNESICTQLSINVNCITNSNLVPIWRKW